MMTANRTGARRRLDLWGVSLIFIGLAFGVFAFWLVNTAHFNALIVIPSIVSFTIGTAHMFKLEAPRD